MSYNNPNLPGPIEGSLGCANSNWIANSPTLNQNNYNQPNNNGNNNNFTPKKQLSLSVPPLSPISSPKPTPLKSPYSPIMTSHTNPLRSKYIYSPYNCSPSKPGISSPNRNPKRLQSMNGKEYLSIDSPQRITRRRSQSLSFTKPTTKDPLFPPIPDGSLFQYPLSPSLRRRSQSIDLSSLHHTIQPSRVFNHCYSLTLKYDLETRHLLFSGKTLEELKNSINSCFTVLPVVRVCIEHPSIPNHLVNITSVDQLYDNAVIHLVPLDK